MFHAAVYRANNYIPQRLSPELTDLRHSRWLFAALCFYILSQAYHIPLITIGPWALWPRMADFAVVALALAYAWSWRSLTVLNQPAASVLIGSLAFFGLSVISFLGYLAFQAADGANGIVFGAFQIVTLFKFLFIFWCVAHIPINDRRRVILLRCVDLVMLLTSIGIIVTYLNLVPLPVLAPHIPANDQISGPWASYQIAEWPWERRAWGTIGYNHAYVAIQVLLLVALRMHLSAAHITLSDSLWLALAVLVVFLSGSRSGLAGTLLFAGIFFLRRPAYAWLISIIAGLLIIFAFLLFPQTRTFATELEDSLMRQGALLNANDSQNLSGRDEIWQQRIAFLNAEPRRWFIGVGFGAGVDSGNFAHMLPLQITLETGMIGLAFFGLMFGIILLNLVRCDKPKRSILWVTLAFFFTSLTQETFYPVPALGHFMGFYLCTVAIVLCNSLQPTSPTYVGAAS